MQFPLINGDYFAFADIELRANGLLFAGVKSINYKAALNRQFVRGTSSIPLGRTRGNYEASGDIELYLNAANFLITSLGPTWMQVPIQISVSYGPNVGMIQPVITDLLNGVYLTSIEASQSQGEDALTRKFELSVQEIQYNSEFTGLLSFGGLGAVG